MPIFAVDIGAKSVAAIGGKDPAEIQQLVASPAVRIKWRVFGLIDDNSKPTIRKATDAENLRWHEGVRRAIEVGAFADLAEAEGDNHVVFLVPVSVPTDREDDGDDGDDE